ncbi:hypothetical protein [Lacinutrix mariniflava]|uniref:hypothetical protein n=1 Tax=Lacinutrix mariniflava TaxID=342955 RepID=UPI0006E25A06|nr:hypothetical protein [Lacinutrix mariniflava]
MSDNLQQYAHVPLKQLSNRVWRTYQGGALIDNWKKTSPEIDNSMPEEWIMSTITARGKDRPENEGLSLIETPDGTLPLKQLIDSNKELYLGKALAVLFKRYFSFHSIQYKVIIISKIQAFATYLIKKVCII